MTRRALGRQRPVRAEGVYDISLSIRSQSRLPTARRLRIGHKLSSYSQLATARIHRIRGRAVMSKTALSSREGRPDTLAGRISSVYIPIHQIRRQRADRKPWPRRELLISHAAGCRAKQSRLCREEHARKSEPWRRLRSPCDGRRELFNPASFLAHESSHLRSSGERGCACAVRLERLAELAW